MIDDATIEHSGYRLHRQGLISGRPVAERAARARPCSEVRLDLPEQGAVGPARVVLVDPCPALETGPGRLVTGRFVHRRGRLLRLRVAGEALAVEVSGPHPFWSVDRGGWASAADLELGERLLAAGGETTVVSLEAGTEELVYNIEVDADHCYRVGGQGILVHNASAAPTTNEGWDSLLQCDPVRYAELRAMEIKTKFPDLYGRTTAAVTVVQNPGNPKSRRVVLTDSNERFGPRRELATAARTGEMALNQPYYAIKRVNPRDVPSANLGGPAYYLAVPKDDPTPVIVNPNNDPVIGYAIRAAERRGYKVIRAYDYKTENLTQTEIRGRAYAKKHGLEVVGQAPTIPVCDKCFDTLGPEGLSVIPSSAYE